MSAAANPVCRHTPTCLAKVIQFWKKMISNAVKAI
jgi:putative component of membrane protein insertase Oxa1/YidC/SpoIIIJ protein YidD